VAARRAVQYYNLINKNQRPQMFVHLLKYNNNLYILSHKCIKKCKNHLKLQKKSNVKLNRRAIILLFTHLIRFCVPDIDKKFKYLQNTVFIYDEQYFINSYE